MSILGTRVLRTEDPRFLTSGGVYTDDVVDERLTGACHVFFVRSPIAHARLLGVDVSAALSAPGVIAAYTGADLADLPLIKPGPMFNPKMARPILATDKVRYVGDPVAVVVTEQAYQGEDAMELVDVDYEPLPAVVDFGDAVSDKVLLYEEAGTNVAANFGDASQLDEHLFDEFHATHPPIASATGPPSCRRPWRRTRRCPGSSRASARSGRRAPSGSSRGWSPGPCR